MRITIPTALTLFRILLLPVMVIVFYSPFTGSNVAAACIFGGEMYDPQKDEITLDNPKVVKALEWMVSYAKKYDVNQLDSVTASFGVASGADSSRTAARSRRIRIASRNPPPNRPNVRVRSVRSRPSWRSDSPASAAICLSEVDVATC